MAHIKCLMSFKYSVLVTHYLNAPASVQVFFNPDTFDPMMGFTSEQSQSMFCLILCVWAVQHLY